MSRAMGARIPTSSSAGREQVIAAGGVVYTRGMRVEADLVVAAPFDGR